MWRNWNDRLNIRAIFLYSRWHFKLALNSTHSWIIVSNIDRILAVNDIQVSVAFLKNKFLITISYIFEHKVSLCC